MWDSHRTRTHEHCSVFINLFVDSSSFSMWTGSQIGYKGEDKSRAQLACSPIILFALNPTWEPVHCGSVATSSLSYLAQAQQASSRSACHVQRQMKSNTGFTTWPAALNLAKILPVLPKHYWKSWKLRSLNFTIVAAQQWLAYLSLDENVRWEKVDMVIMGLTGLRDSHVRVLAFKLEFCPHGYIFYRTPFSLWKERCPL